MSAHDDDHAPEPVPGLPRELPPGERLLWQGSPGWRGILRHTFHARWLAAYFALFVAARGALLVGDGLGVATAIRSSAGLATLAAACLAILALLSWLNARATIYSITSRRVVMRFGVALPMTYNLPFKRLASADLQPRLDGSGDISLALTPPDRIGWLFLWPHVRPWRCARAQPTMKSIPEAAKVAALLAEAVRAWTAEQHRPMLVSSPVSDAAAPAKPPVSTVPQVAVAHGR